MNQEQINEFVFKALRTLQSQNDGLRDDIATLEHRIRELEETVTWNLMQQRLEQSPDDPFVIKLANGRLAQTRIDLSDEEENDTD